MPPWRARPAEDSTERPGVETGDLRASGSHRRGVSANSWPEPAPGSDSLILGWPIRVGRCRDLAGTFSTGRRVGRDRPRGPPQIGRGVCEDHRCLQPANRLLGGDRRAADPGGRRSHLRRAARAAPPGDPGRGLGPAGRGGRAAARELRRTSSSTSPRAPSAARARRSTPASIEQLRIPFTGGNPSLLHMNLDKHLAKTVVAVARRPGTAGGPGDARKPENSRADLEYPLIIKPNAEGSRKGITQDSVVETPTGLRTRINELLETLPRRARGRGVHRRARAERPDSRSVSRQDPRDRRAHVRPRTRSAASTTSTTTT